MSPPLGKCWRPHCLPDQGQGEAHLAPCMCVGRRTDASQAVELVSLSLIKIIFPRRRSDLNVTVSEGKGHDSIMTQVGDRVSLL